MTVIDADGHVTESAEQLVKYMDAPFRNRQLVFPIVPADGWDRRLIRKYHDTAGTADAWLTALDKGGVEQAVLFPTLGLFMSFLKDRSWAVQFCRAYNSFIHEEFVKVSPRLKAVALLPVQDPQAAAQELRRAVRELGHVGAMLAADGSHVLGDERFTPIYEEAQRLLPQALERVGENQIVYASDFPHWDHSFPGSIDEIRDRRDLTDTQKRKVLADNSRTLYKLQ